VPTVIVNVSAGVTDIAVEYLKSPPRPPSASESVLLPEAPPPIQTAEILVTPAGTVNVPEAVNVCPFILGTNNPYGSMSVTLILSLCVENSYF